MPKGAVPVIDVERGFFRVDDVELTPQVDENRRAACIVHVDVLVLSMTKLEGHRTNARPREKLAWQQLEPGSRELVGQLSERGDQHGFLVLDRDRHGSKQVPKHGDNGRSDEKSEHEL
ncbi:MAG: hypothetical protein U0174_18350 [Polyangiaceae bacterium]